MSGAWDFGGKGVKKCQNQKLLFLEMSVCINRSEFECRQIRKQYFEVRFLSTDTPIKGEFWHFLELENIMAECIVKFLRMGYKIR